MAVTQTIIHKTAAKGDYTTIASWEAQSNNATDGTANGDAWVGIICDAADYVEAVTFDQSTSDSSSTAYVRLTANDGVLETVDDEAVGLSSVRHDGSTGGCATVQHTSGHILTVDEDYVVIDHLELHMDASGGTSNECIRLSAGADNCVIDSNIIWNSDNTAQQDGIYTGNYDVRALTITNNTIFGHYRYGLHFQQYTASGTHLGEFYVFHNTIFNCTEGIYFDQSAASDTHTLALQNNVVFWTTNDYVEESQAGTVTYDGSENLSEAAGGTTDFTGNGANALITDDILATDGGAETTKSTGSWIVIESYVTTWPTNESDVPIFRPLDDAAGNDLTGTGSDTYDTGLPTFAAGVIEGVVGGILTLDARGYKRAGTTPDVGAYSYEDNVSGLAITPGVTTVTATAGTLTITTTTPVVPGATAVSATPGSMVVTTLTSVVPAPVSVSATPGTAVLTTTVPVVPDPVTVTATPGALTVTPPDTQVVPDAVGVSATPGSLSVQLAQSVTPEAVAVAAAAGSMVVTTGAVGVTPAATSVTATPGSLVLALITHLTPAPVSVAAAPGSVVVTSVAAVVPDPTTVNVAPGSLTVALAASPDQALIPLPVGVSVSTGELTGVVNMLQEIGPGATVVRVIATSVVITKEAYGYDKFRMGPFQPFSNTLGSRVRRN